MDGIAERRARLATVALRSLVDFPPCIVRQPKLESHPRRTHPQRPPPSMACSMAMTSAKSKPALRAEVLSTISIGNTSPRLLTSHVGRDSYTTSSLLPDPAREAAVAQRRPSAGCSIAPVSPPFTTFGRFRIPRLGRHPYTPFAGPRVVSPICCPVKSGALYKGDRRCGSMEWVLPLRA